MEMGSTTRVHHANDVHNYLELSCLDKKDILFNKCINAHFFILLTYFIPLFLSLYI